MNVSAAVMGAGHDGLTCAYYLARAGLRVVVPERAERIGEAVHTAETIPEAPGYRFDTCSVKHNLIQAKVLLRTWRSAAYAAPNRRYVHQHPIQG